MWGSYATMQWKAQEKVLHLDNVDQSCPKNGNKATPVACKCRSIVAESVKTAWNNPEYGIKQEPMRYCFFSKVYRVIFHIVSI